MTTTLPLHASRVTDCILHTLTAEFGNANSIDHIYGDAAEKAVKIKQAADILADTVAQIRQLI
ncbi:hypothetical protein [Spirulina sp. 06S082]|uniref:hypothetical protein n=1 Tax=Spirulina sp. 06S082 TaxID=3110248 RepID=UPI002B21B38B|nr:hypothetical protein [Spirulina sp. 06S082]MEA5469159.1 hypothetical protein [Spirulina sp. 06S082]